MRFTGPALPFGADPAAVFGPKPDKNVVITSIYNILTTHRGSVPYNPNIGSFIPDLLFEPLDDVTLHLIRHYAAKELAEQEPRIKVTNVFTARTGDTSVAVTVNFQVVGDPSADVIGTSLNFAR